MNLLESYPQGCAASCSYCGLARERPGMARDNSFIRVSWPLHPTDRVAERIAEARRGIGRVCVAEVQDARAHEDLLDITRRIRSAAAGVPISALVSAPTLDEARLWEIQRAGADIIGIGLDAATPELFDATRGRGVKGPHDWEQHWEIARAARRVFGPWKVNFHVIVGLGESDRGLVELFYRLCAEEIAAYLFSFNPEPGTRMQDASRAPLARLRRIQLVKHLIEQDALPREAIGFDAAGRIRRLDAPGSKVEAALMSGVPFMTGGCPDREGGLACNRPYGSYRPGEAFRDYPFRPGEQDLATIRSELRLEEVF
ncbi:MAG: radical SAM protein [Planctomycetota bacterium]